MTHEHLKTLALAAKAAAQTQNWWTADQLGVSGPDTDFIEAATPAPSCPYCACSATLGAVYFDQNCAGCVNRMGAKPAPTPSVGEYGELIKKLRRNPRGVTGLAPRKDEQ